MSEVSRRGSVACVECKKLQRQLIRTLSRAMSLSWCHSSEAPAAITPASTWETGLSEADDRYRPGEDETRTDGDICCAFHGDVEHGYHSADDSLGSSRAGETRLWLLSCSFRYL